MTNKTVTKRALTTSALAILACIAMLIGITFAWFTDTASTAVNKIVSGNLKVGLEYAIDWDKDGNPTAWDDANGKTLNFKTADGRTANILWEPNCTYALPELRVVNNGKLALKYKIQITGIKGDAKLNDVIEWTINNADMGTEYHLLPEKVSDVITIKGHMDENANNDYQDLSITGIGITVLATQDTVESDSFDENYDALAEYPLYAMTPVEKNDDGLTTSAAKIVSEKKNADTGLPLATATAPVGTKMEDGQNRLILSIEETATPANFTATADGESCKTLEVQMKGLAADNDKLIKVEMYVPANLVNFRLYHENDLMNSKSDISLLAADQDYYYDSTTGLVTMLTTKFSPYTYTYYIPKTIEVSTAEELNNAITSAKSGDTIVLGADINSKLTVPQGKTIVFDLKGHKLNNLVINMGNLTIIDSVGSGEIAGSTYGISSGSATFVYNVSVVNASSDAKLTINGGKLSGKWSLMPVADNSEIVLNGGTYTGNVGPASQGTYNMHLTINGGTFTGPYLQAAQSKELKAANDLIAARSTVTINGGTFNFTKNTAYDSGISLSATTLSITGGEFNTSINLSDVAYVESTGSISGGTFNKDVVISGGADAVITGGSFRAMFYLKASGYKMPAPTAKILGGNFTGTVKIENFTQYSNYPIYAECEIAGGTFNLTDMSVQEDAKVAITAGTFNIDPSAYVNTDTHTVTHDGTVWTVSAK